MIKKLIFTLACIVSSAMLVSCGDDFVDGNWDPIEITVNGIKCKSNVCEVPANGGVFKIFTKNYGSPWLNEVDENGKRVWPIDGSWTDYKDIDLKGDWYSVQYDKSGNIMVTIMHKVADTPERNIKFYLECGDSFGEISLVQK